jgi:Na+/H+-translocating membrane pyrophosphatase
MQKLFIILFAPFPCFIGLSLAFLILKPEERLNALIMLPIAVLGTILTQFLGHWLRKKEKWQFAKMEIIASQIGGLILGVIVFLIVYFNLV